MLNESESSVGPAMTILDNPLLDLSRLEDLRGDQAIRLMFDIYKRLVEKYTTRELSFGGDILNAFAGVFAVLGEHIHGSTLCGLPAAFLDLALLWTPALPLERREDVVPGADVTARGGTSESVRCPTWSWAGFVGPVEYRMFSQEEERYGGVHKK